MTAHKRMGGRGKELRCEWLPRDQGIAKLDMACSSLDGRILCNTVTQEEGVFESDTKEYAQR
jgi:hypothetical protein